MKRFLIAVALLPSLAGTMVAQTATKPAPAAGPPPPAVKPDPALVKPYHQRFRMVMARGTQEQEVGSLDDEVTVGEHNGKPAIIRVQNASSSAGVMTDTAVADAGSLAPRWHSSHAERRSLRLEFEPSRVTGVYWEPGDPSFPIDQKISESLYDSNMLDVLVGALPLAEGFKGRLMVYLYENGGPTPVDVAVTGAQQVAGTDTWITNITIAGRTARYYVGKTDHHVAQIISTPQPGVEIRLVRTAL